MKEAAALGQEIHALVVGHEAVGEIVAVREASRTEPANPRIVVLVMQHARVAGRGIEREQPRVFVVDGAHRQHRVRTVIAPEQCIDLDVALRRFFRLGLLRRRLGRRLRRLRRIVLRGLDAFETVLQRQHLAIGDRDRHDA